MITLNIKVFIKCLNFKLSFLLLTVIPCIYECAIVEYLARVQPLISRIVRVDLNQKTTKIVIDESKMAVHSSFSFLNR